MSSRLSCTFASSSLLRTRLSFYPFWSKCCEVNSVLFIFDFTEISLFNRGLLEYIQWNCATVKFYRLDRIVSQFWLNIFFFFRYNVYYSVFKFKKKMDVSFSIRLHGIKIRVSFRANRLSREERSASCPSRRKGSRKGRRWEIKDREEIITKPWRSDKGINIWQRNLGRRKLISPVQLTCWSSIESLLPGKTER